MKRFGVLLCGCGVKDGSEIHEATLTLLFLDRQGVERVCLAPDAPQAKVVDHCRDAESGEQRNMLAESARIARGEIQPLARIRAADLDGLIIPGGLGAALNLCDYATQGSAMEVRPDVAQLILALHQQQKPIGAICIAPVVVAKVLGGQGIAVEVTLGDAPQVAADVEAMGAKHVMHLVDEAHIDRVNKVVTTPAYMLGRNTAEIAPGIQRLVDAMVDMA